MYAPNSKWTLSFLGISVVQSLFVLAFEIYVFAVLQDSISVSNQGIDDSVYQVLAAAIPTFLSLYIFALVYQLVLVYNALQRQNTIQILGLVMMNLGLVVYGALQLVAVDDVVSNLFVGALFEVIRPFLIAIPCILSVSTCAMAFVAWKLWHEFAWTILRLVSADLRMRQRYLNYQIYLTLLKFGLFYYVGFTIQFIVIIKGRTNTEFGLTVACIPITLIALIMARYFIKRESTAGMVVVIVLFVAGLAFFTFKLVRMFNSAHSAPYIPVRREFLGFGILTMIVLLATLAYAGLCMSAFGKGLKHFVNKPIMEDDLDLDHHNGYESAASGGYQHRSGQNIEMMSDLRARLGGYRPTRNGQ